MHSWYLARLRKLATVSGAHSEKMTPMSLVESDKKLIREIVTQAADSQAVRAKKLEALIEAQRDWTEHMKYLLLLIGFIGLFLIAFALLP